MFEGCAFQDGEQCWEPKLGQGDDFKFSSSRVW